MPKVLVSVIMPIYNAEKYLRKSLDTILSQSYTNIELICVDDGSNDGSLNILKEYSAKDPRMEVITQKNQYAGVARNNGMRIARGKYLIFLDADDFFHRDLIEKAVNKAEETNAQVVIFNAGIFDDEKQVEVSNDWILNEGLIPSKEVFSAKEYADNIFNISTTAAWNKLFERNYIFECGLKFQNISHINDLLFTTSAVSLAERICILDEKLITYRIGNTNSLQRRKNKRLLDFIDAFKGLYEFLNEKKIWNFYRKSYIKLCFYNIIGYLDQQNSSELFEQFFRLVQSELMPLMEDQDVNLFENKYYSDRFYLMRRKNVKEYLHYEYKYEKGRDVSLCKTIADLEVDIRNMEVNMEVARSIINKKIWRFPYESYPIGSKIIIYGAGNVGEDFYDQISKNKYFELAGWVDRNYLQIRKRYQCVEKPESIKEKAYDYIIIAINDKEVAGTVQSDLLKMGIPKEKIKYYEI